MIGTVRVILSVAALMAASWAPAWAQTTASNTTSAPKDSPRDLDLPIEGVLSPEWTEIPTAEQMSQFYPKLAQSLWLAGRVQLTCQSTIIGTLEHCRVESEKPAGLAFGDAALLLSPYFHFQPKLLRGKPTGGDEVSFSIHFQLPPYAPPQSEPKQAVSPHGVELARQVMGATGVEDNVRKQIASYATALRNQLDSETPDGQLNTPQSATAFAAFQQAWDAAVPVYLDEIAANYARIYTEAEMTEMLAFWRSPAGKAWIDHQGDVSRSMNQGGEQLAWTVSQEAQRLICQKIDCVDGPTQPALTPTPAK